MEKENIKDAINVLLKARKKYSQVAPGNLPGATNNNNVSPSTKGKIKNVQLPAIGENEGNVFVPDPSANTLLLKPGLNNKQIEQLAMPVDLRLVPQISLIINDVIKKSGYSGQEQLNPQQENQLAQSISNELEKLLSAHGNLISLLAVSK